VGIDEWMVLLSAIHPLLIKANRFRKKKVDGDLKGMGYYGWWVDQRQGGHSRDVSIEFVPFGWLVI
jgi:hypothetical protein